VISSEPQPPTNFGTPSEQLRNPRKFALFYLLCAQVFLPLVRTSFRHRFFHFGLCVCEYALNVKPFSKIVRLRPQNSVCCPAHGGLTARIVNFPLVFPLFRLVPSAVLPPPSAQQTNKIVLLTHLRCQSNVWSNVANMPRVWRRSCKLFTLPPDSRIPRSPDSQIPRLTDQIAVSAH